MEGKWLRKPTGDTSVVFIHGIFSNADKCWLNENGTYWPDLLEKEKFYKEVGIYLYSYKTSVFSGTYSLNDVVADLNERLVNLDGVFDSKQVIFVCHSMGGIVARKFLVDRIIYFPDPTVKIGLFFISTPSLGSYYANWLNILAKFFNNSQADALRFSEKNIWLSDLDTSFMTLYDSRKYEIKGKELIEDEPITYTSLLKPFISPVVERFSGNRYFGNPYKVPNSNHLSISTPEDNKSIQHRMLCSFLGEYVSKQAKLESAKRRDADLFKKHLIAFRRPLFQMPCVYEFNLEEVLQAIEDTTLAINTGQLYTRHDKPLLLGQYTGSFNFETNKYISSFTKIASELQKLKYLVSTFKQYFITQFPAYKGYMNTYDMLNFIKNNCTSDEIKSHVYKMDEIDLKRNAILEILNKLPTKPKFPLIELSSNILKKGGMGGAGIQHLF